MKKFLAVAFSVAALSSVAVAQGPDSYNEGAEGSIGASAYVRVPMTMFSIRPMDLGVLERGMTDQPVETPAHFKIWADEGDLVWVQANGGGDIVLVAQHDGEGAAAASSDPDTDGPDDYINDVNGQAGAINLLGDPTAEIHVEQELRYRFIDNDEEHSVLWDLPTWTARNGYYDFQNVGGVETMFGPITGLPEGIGQINIFVGGTFDTAIDQQRGLYLGNVDLVAWYDEDWAPSL